MIRPDPFGDKEQGDNAATEQVSGAAHVRALQRCIAEAHLRQGSVAVRGGAEACSQEEAKQLLHELRVYQVELEMQNEALRESQIALDAVRARYFDLYDLAPIAYCTVSEQGLIWQANLATANLLGLTRNALLNQPFSRYIFAEDQDTYYFGRRRLASSKEAQSFELRLVGLNGTPFWAGLTVAIGQDSAGKQELRIVLSDIGGRRTVEAENARLRQALLEKNTEFESACGVNAVRERARHIFEISRGLETRLHAILDRLQAGGSPALTQEQKQSIDRIGRTGSYLLSLIDALLDPAAAAAAKAKAMPDMALVPPVSHA